MRASVLTVGFIGTILLCVSACGDDPASDSPGGDAGVSDASVQRDAPIRGDALGGKGGSGARAGNGGSSGARPRNGGSGGRSTTPSAEGGKASAEGGRASAAGGRSGSAGRAAATAGSTPEEGGSGAAADGGVIMQEPIEPRELKIPRTEKTLTDPLCVVRPDTPDTAYLSLEDFALDTDDTMYLLTHESDSLLTKCGDGGWSHHFPGNRRLNAMAVTSQGSVVLGGKISDICLVIQVAADGVEGWTHNVGEPGRGTCQIYSVAADDAGNVYVAATFGNVLPGDDEDARYLSAIVIKYDAAGEQLWVWHPEIEVPYDAWINTANFNPLPTVSVDPTGGVLVTLNSALAKLTEDGSEQWRSFVRPSTSTNPKASPGAEGDMYLAWGPYVTSVDKDGYVRDVTQYINTTEITDAEGTTWRGEMVNPAPNRSGVLLAGETVLFHGIVTNTWRQGAALPSHDALLISKLGRDLVEQEAVQVILGPSQVIGVLGAPIIRLDSEARPILAAFHKPESALGISGLVWVVRAE
jgi:hypothetical protein